MMAVQEGDRLSQVGLAFLNMLASPEELEQDLPQEKRQKREVALQSQPRRKHQRPSSPHSSSTSSTRSEESGQVMKLCRLMGQLLIRHEDSLNSVSMQDSFVLFFQQGNSGVLPLLLRTAKQWHDLPADQAMIPLRSYLIQAVINELTNRFQKLKLQLSDDSTKQAAIKSLTILEDSSFPHLIWHHQHKRLVISQTAPISWSSMETHLGILQQAFLEPTNCVRFFAMASQQSRSEVVPWKLQISMRNDSLSSLLRQLTGSALWHLIGARLKQHGLQRSKLAQDIQMVLRPQGGRK